MSDSIIREPRGRVPAHPSPSLCAAIEPWIREHDHVMARRFRQAGLAAAWDPEVLYNIDAADAIRELIP